MKKLVLLAAILISGCVEYVSPEYMEHVLTYCKANGGIDRVGVERIDPKPYVYFHVICKDGASYSGRMVSAEFK